MVHIKNIRMTGFKSFGTGSKTVQLAPGFTCIVGPNGSGKSNSIDAISFCLGTLSKKSMRANKLTDLLYNGVKGDEPAKKAMVEIEFDNHDLKIPIKEKTILVSRELKRNGTGTYRLNGKRSTRTDILDKLRIAGIDCVDGFNIIQQGQISEIVGMSPIQRRELLEGVAGVGQFDDKKEAAIAELDEAQRKMGELNLLINELTIRVDSLRSEKEAAEKWIELGDAIQKLKSELLSVRLITLQKDIDLLNAEIDTENTTISDLEGQKQGVVELNKLQGEVKEKQGELKILEERQFRITEELNSIRIEVAKLEQTKEFTLREVDQKQKDIKRDEKEVGNLNSSIEKMQQQIQQAVKEIQSHGNREQDIQVEVETLKEEIADKESEYEDAKDEYERIERQFRNISDQITKLEISVDMSKSVMDSFDKNKTVKDRQVAEIENEMQKTKDKIASTQDSIDKGTDSLEETQKRVSISEGRLTMYDDKIEAKKTEIGSLSDENLVLKTKIDMIRNSLQQTEEVNVAAQHILDNKDDFPGVLGTLETIIGGEKKIPKTLKHLKHALVAENLSSILNCIHKLKEGVIGSCEFLPMDRMGVSRKNFNKDIEKKFATSSMIVDSIDEAVKLWEKNKNVQVQTITGDIFYPNGLINGGFHRSTAADQLESMNDTLNTKEGELEQHKGELKIHETAKGRIIKAYNLTKKLLQKVEKDIRDSIIQLQHLKENQKQEKQLYERYCNERNSVKSQLEEKKTQVEKMDRELEEFTVNRERIENERDEAKETMESLDVTSLKDNLSRLNIDLMQIENQKSRNEERKENLEASIKENNEKIGQLEKRKVELLKEIEDLNKQHEENNVRINTISGEAAVKENEFSMQKDEIRTKKQEIGERRRGIEKIEKDNSKLDSRIQQCKDTIGEIKINRAKLETEQESLFNEARDNELEIIEMTKEIMDTISPKKHQREIDKLIDSRKKLEPVNMRSIEDFEEQNKRLQQIVDTKKVLIEERQVILDFIVQLETEKTNTFMRAFTKINRAFNEIFKELADGSAQLILENDEDVFSGGVSMEAHPAGKKVKSLESMSGGEKALTALAFIFAIQQSEPQPFYVLDEIDAALDIKNVDKVGRLIAKMAKGTSEFGKAQFLVISHRDILMAKAETIYGTTNVGGITQMMQIQLDEKGLHREITKTKFEEE